jgi:hypothetical protein
MLTRERRPDFRTVDRWAISLLLEAGAIHKCDEHGWAKDRTDPHAREDVLPIACEEPLAGLIHLNSSASQLEKDKDILGTG